MVAYMDLRDDRLEYPNTAPSCSALAHTQLLRYATIWT